jgi:lysophospholipase L1-like esterase
MDFFTRIDIPAANFKIDYTSHIAFFGSCFADNISSQFANRKFHTLANPFGTVYNPVSMARQIHRIVEGKLFGNEDVFQGSRVTTDAPSPWHCWDAHGSLSASTREECIANLNAAATRTREFLQKADTVFITLGTAFVYFLKSSNDAVANCHRQDPSLFDRRMITVEEATQAIENIVQDLRMICADILIVFTVSPLRHMADGAHENSLSKSTLQLAIHGAIKALDGLSGQAIGYFSSYEIVMDELRDYRFYADDMIHLSKTAEDYIFERMAETFCDERTRRDIAAVEKFMKMAKHRIVSPANANDFLQKVRDEAKALEAKIPGLDLHEGENLP